MKSTPITVQAYAVDPQGTYYPTASAPSAPPAFAPSSFVPPNQAGARAYLQRFHWPLGLQNSILKGLDKIPIRFIICDDSGSMSASDGKRMIISGSACKRVNCTRWNELTTSLAFHAQFAHEANAPTEFRLLNGAPPIMIGDGNDPDGVNLNRFQDALNQSPNGGTPLCRHISEIVTKIRAMEQQLRAAGKKACIIIATDGESSDGDIATALRPLKDLPCWVVIRLCTDEDRITDYWNNIDSELELEMDVLDDLYGEAQEVNAHNSWLTYGEPLHRIREFGIPMKELDLLDETKLSLDQVLTVCSLIFGGSARDYPHPDADFPAFEAKIKDQLKEAGHVGNPITNRVSEWVDVHKISRLRQGSGFGCIVM